MSVDRYKNRDVSLMSRFVPGQYFQLKDFLNASKTPEDLAKIKVLDLSRNRAAQMPNVDITLALFFKHITTLDVSHNFIESLEAQHLAKACPLLEVFIFNDNQVTNIREILPLGRLKHLKTLEFRNNPVVATTKQLKNMKEKVIYEQKQLSASEKMKFPSLSLINGEPIEIPLNDDQFQSMVDKMKSPNNQKPPMPKYEQHKYEQKMIYELYKDTQLYQSRNPHSEKKKNQKLMHQTVTISASDIANDKLGMNDRIIFNKGMVRKLSGKDLPLKKIKQIFMKPRLEQYDSWIKERIEFQTGLGLGEKIKNTENFDSSDEEEFKKGQDTLGLTLKNGKQQKRERKDSSDDSQLSTRSATNRPLQKHTLQHSDTQKTVLRAQTSMLKRRQVIIPENSEMLKKQMVVQHNREELDRNLNHFVKQLKNKELKVSHEEVRRMIDENVFKGGVNLVMPKVRMLMINEKIDEKSRPQAIRDAIRIAEEEKILYQKMKDTDPHLLREDAKALDPERIRQTFYSILQDDYPKQSYKQLKKINNQIYPRTPFILNDLKAKRMLENPEGLSLERLLFLEDYLSKIQKLRFNPELAQKKAQEIIKNEKLKHLNQQENNRQVNQQRRPPKPKPAEVIFRRKKAVDIIQKFPRLRKPGGNSSDESDFEGSQQNESKRSSSAGIPSTGGSQNGTRSNSQKQIEAYAYCRWKDVLKKGKQLDEHIRPPTFSIIDDKSIHVGTTKSDCFGEQDKYDNQQDSGEPDPDSYEHIKEIVSKLLKKQIAQNHNN